MLAVLRVGDELERICCTKEEQQDDGKWVLNQ
jgi:hypothetical protein